MSVRLQYINLPTTSHSTWVNAATFVNNPRGTGLQRFEVDAGSHATGKTWAVITQLGN
jgi:hypothetical protein